MNQSAKQNRRILTLIAGGLLAWGLFHALGAYLLNHNPWRALMVASCVGAFLAFWGMLLFSRASRLARRRVQDAEFPRATQHDPDSRHDANPYASPDGEMSTMLQ